MQIKKEPEVGNKQNLQETLFELKKVFASPLLAESILNKTLLIELKHLQKFCPAGIYIIPQSDNIKIWDGIIFPREGIYRDGIFKYQIHIPPDYPNAPPQVIFISKVFHPLINPKTGVLDLSEKFPKWEPVKCFLVRVIYYIQEIFKLEEYYKKKNEEITPEIQKKVSACVKESIEKKFENSPKSSMKFSEFNKYHKLILDKILNQNKDLSTADRIEDFKNWFMNNFMELIQNYNSKNENSKKNKTKK